MTVRPSFGRTVLFSEPTHRAFPHGIWLKSVFQKTAATGADRIQPAKPCKIGELKPKFRGESASSRRYGCYQLYAVVYFVK
jgi:hypothetical protein